MTREATLIRAQSLLIHHQHGLHMVVRQCLEHVRRTVEILDPIGRVVAAGGQESQGRRRAFGPLDNAGIRAARQNIKRLEQRHVVGGERAIV